jgi:membrane protein DedA with SNARE-associated domain
MFENILSEISGFTPLWIYLTIFFFAYIENIFPPSPSDLVVLIGGSLVATGAVNFALLFLFATLGSLTGFLTAFMIGWQFDKKLIHSGKLKFINIQSVEKVENSFRKYGYFLIIANRFLPGTRAVISFFAGMSKLDIKKTTSLCLISAAFWNGLLIYLGLTFGQNVEVVDKYITSYSNIVIAATALILLFFIIRYFIKIFKTKN